MSRKETEMKENNIMTKQCKYNCTMGICNGKSCKTCHCNEDKPKEMACSISYGAIKRYNSKNGKTYRTEVMRF